MEYKPLVIKGVVAQCGPGWFPLISELNDRLNELDPDYRVDQIKEKFGGLRYYASPSYDCGISLLAIIVEFEARSYKTCENCGQPGKERDDRNWIRTLCDTCAGS